MSIVRWGENNSNVYVIKTDEGWWCVGCGNEGGKSKDLVAFTAHLKWHEAQGHIVPEYVYKEILSAEDA